MNNETKVLCACYLLIRGYHKDPLEIIQSINFEEISDHSFDELCKHVVSLNHPFLKYLENNHKKIKEQYLKDAAYLAEVERGEAEYREDYLQGKYTEISETLNFYYNRALKDFK